MRIHRWLVVALLAACGWFSVRLTTPLAAQQPSATASTEQASAEERELNARYAKAYLRLVEATLERYQEVNRRRPNTIRRGVIQAIEEGVAEARDRVKLATSDDANHAEIYVSSAEATLRAAQAELGKAETVNQQKAGTVSPGEIERLKADIELAKVRVEKARHLASESPLSNVRFEVEQLREDVQELRLLVALLRDRN